MTGAGAIAVPTLDYVKSSVAAITADTIHRIRQVGHESLADIHNKYAAYSALLMIHATGHRWCSDPFAWPSSISREGGFGTIFDKVASAAHANRMVWIPDLAMLQFERYLKHLDALARRLLLGDGQSADIANAILSTLEQVQSGKATSLPIFFFINDSGTGTFSISLESLSKVFPSWRMPHSAARNLIASDLPSFGVSQTLIDLQLMHLHDLSHPLGETSALAPEAAGKRLRPALQKMLQEQGWTAIDGLNARRIPKAKRKRSGHDQKEVHCPELWGEMRRRKEREKDAGDDHEFVSAFISKTFPKGPPKVLLRAETNALRDSLVEASSAAIERAGLRVTLLFKYLKNLQFEGRAIELPGKIKILDIEPTPFAEGFSSQFDRATQLRKKLHEILERRLLGEPSPPARRLGEISVSAIVHGALINPQLAARLSEAIPDRTFPDGDTLWIEIAPETQEVWCADRFTSGLIHRHLKLKTQAEIRPDTSAIATEVGILLKEAGVQSVSLARPLEQLVSKLASFWQYYLPGHLYPLAKGTLRQTSLPRSTLARIRSGLPLNIPAIPTEQDGEEVAIAWPATRKDALQLGPRDFDRALARILKHLKSAAPKKGQLRNRNLRTQLAKEVGQELNGDRNYPHNIVVLAIWLAHLCQHGTVFKKNLSLDNTIIPYYTTVRRSLIPILGDRSILDLTDTEITSVYAKTVACRETSEGKDELLRLLREFHRFLILQFDMDVIDWLALGWRPRAEDPPMADADALSEDEYLATLQMLQDSDQTRTSPDMLCGLLILGYRFGTRFGEALCVEARDLYIEDESAFLEIRPNQVRELKTEAGRRAVPSLGKLTPNESAVLARLKSRRIADAEDPATLLFSLAGSPRKSISRADASLEIHRALRDVTGNNDFRYHHLRHTFANRLYSIVMFNSDHVLQTIQLLPPTLDCTATTTSADADADAMRFWLTGQAELIPDSLMVIEDFLGHECITTTFASYIHLTCIAIAKIAAHAAPLEIKDEAMAKLCDVRRETIVRTRKRDGGSNQNYWKALTWTSLLAESFGVILGKARPAKMFRLPDPSFDLPELDRLLRRRQQHSNPDDLAFAFGRSVEQVIRVLHSAARLAELSGYDRYGDFGDQWFEKELTSNITVGPPPPQLNTFLRNASLPHETLSGLSSAWAECLHHQQSRHRWLFQSPHALLSFIDGLIALGVSTKAICLLVPRGVIHETDDADEVMPHQLFATAVRTQLEVRGVDYSEWIDTLPIAGRRVGAATVGISLVQTDAQTPISPTRLDRAFFLLSVRSQIETAPVYR